MMRFSPILAIVPAAVILDQIIKWLIETRFVYEKLVPVLPFLGLYRTWNEGIAFSLFSGLPDAWLVVLTVLIIGFVLYLWSRAPVTHIFARIGFALIIGGAIGNLIDRALLGYVVDYVLFHTPVWSFAVFNLADTFISIGATLILLQEVLDWRRGRG
jgi:signal peptidase II